MALSLLIVGWMVILGTAACTGAESQPEQAIVGQWVNTQGGTIHFYADRSGFIPGDEGQTPAIPSVSFTYYFEDETHLGIRMEGQDPIVVEFQLEGDTMTWRMPGNGAEFVYARAK